MKIVLSWYSVKDLGQAAKFYGETLGMKKVFEMPGWAEFGEGPDGPCIGLNQMSPDETGATVVFRVANVDATRTELEKKGVKFTGPTEEIPGAVRIATFLDPFGNKLQVVQPLLKQ